jgi:hypothetical protein
MGINELPTLTKDVVEAARQFLVIGDCLGGPGSPKIRMN